MDPFTLALLAASTGLGVYNQQRTAAKQSRAQTENARMLRERQQEASQRAMQEVEAMRESGPEQARETAASQYMDAVRRGQGSVDAALPDTPAASAAFQERRGQAQGQVSDYATQMADLMSRIDAPINQRRQEGFNRNRMMGDIGLIRDRAQGDDYVNQLRMQTIMPNPYLSILSQLGQGYAMGSIGAPTDPSQTGATGWQALMDRFRRTGRTPPTPDGSSALGTITPGIRGMNA